MKNSHEKANDIEKIVLEKIDELRKKNIKIPNQLEIHYLNAVTEHFAEQLGMKKINDQFTSGLNQEVLATLMSAAYDCLNAPKTTFKK